VSAEERAARLAAAERELAEIRARADELAARWARLQAMADEAMKPHRCQEDAQEAARKTG